MFTAFKKKLQRHRMPTQTHGEEGVKALEVDLKLPKNKLPTHLKDAHIGTPKTIEHLVHDYAIGSSNPSEKVYYNYDDMGLFQCILTTWKNHWKLKTSPDDWWFPVACRIAKAIDENAEREDVRKYFVNHEGKKELNVDVLEYNIYQVNYESFFSAMTGQIKSNINIPGFADTMKNDFSTSNPAQQIASQINLMSSMQKYFSYSMGLCGCGIMGLEMLGEQSDWDGLVTKLKKVREQLKPIQNSIWLRNDWFDHVEHVFENLAKTYKNPNSQEVADFWANILMESDDWKYGPSGFGGHAAEAYNGWLIKFLLGRKKILKEELNDNDIKQKLSGLNSVPVTITKKYLNPPVSDTANLVAGIMGYQLHQKSSSDTPCIQPNHMWAIKLPPTSPLRGNKLSQ